MVPPKKIDAGPDSGPDAGRGRCGAGRGRATSRLDLLRQAPTRVGVKSQRTISPDSGRGRYGAGWEDGFGVNVAMRPAFAGHAYAWTWRELVITRVVLKKVGE